MIETNSTCRMLFSGGLTINPDGRIILCCVSTQKELADQDIRATMMREQQDALEQDMAPFGFVVNGLEDENIGEMVDEYGTRWNPVVRDYGSNW